ncbi:hypothetical protein JTB14_038211 [Gonioctena quinquepunctata]|nr:hypothetical protein JTB14_038211 [Gonioctena quinquepunctata]
MNTERNFSIIILYKSRKVLKKKGTTYVVVFTGGANKAIPPLVGGTRKRKYREQMPFGFLWARSGVDRYKNLECIYRY